MFALDLTLFAHGVRILVFVMASLGLGTAGAAVVEHLQAEAAVIDPAADLSADYGLPRDVAALLVTSDRR